MVEIGSCQWKVEKDEGDEDNSKLGKPQVSIEDLKRKKRNREKRNEMEEGFFFSDQCKHG